MSKSLSASIALMLMSAALGSCQTASTREVEPAVKMTAVPGFVPEEELELRVLSVETRTPELGELVSDPVHFRPARSEFAVPCRSECALSGLLREVREETPSPFVPASSTVLRKASANDFYVTLGTGVADPEKDSSWTSAAIYPLDTSAPTVPAMRIFGQTAREMEPFQVAPGIFWWPTEDLQVTLAVPFGMSDTAPEVGVLLALTY